MLDTKLMTISRHQKMTPSRKSQTTYLTTTTKDCEIQLEVNSRAFIAKCRYRIDNPLLHWKPAEVEVSNTNCD